ncbi:MAG: hypothetical protein K8H86_12730 [Ignavibacteriaceae bacterium]|nr:hypothetical protein [Ignavibacteriaceae bacterium]
MDASIWTIKSMEPLEKIKNKQRAIHFYRHINWDNFHPLRWFPSHRSKQHLPGTDNTATAQFENHTHIKNNKSIRVIKTESAFNKTIGVTK